MVLELHLYDFIYFGFQFMHFPVRMTSQPHIVTYVLYRMSFLEYLVLPDDGVVEKPKHVALKNVK